MRPLAPSSTTSCYSALDRAAEYCDEPSVSVCVYVCVDCLSVCDHISGTSRPIFTKFLCTLPMAVARSSTDGVVIMLRISRFCGWRHICNKLLGCSTSPPGWGSEAHTYAGLGLARTNTRCRQRTLGSTSCSQGLLGRSERVEYLWHHACT